MGVGVENVRRRENSERLFKPLRHFRRTTRNVPANSCARRWHPLQVDRMGNHVWELAEMLQIWRFAGRLWICG
jgi:hypothetical protein